MSLYHARVIDPYGAQVKPPQPGDWLRVAGIDGDEILLRHASAAQVIAAELERLSELERAAVKAAAKETVPVG